MASDGEVSCINDPNFAVICSFLDVFSKLCAIEPPSILQLQELIENTQEVLEPLKELHLKLLRRTLRSVRPDRWEKFLIKFCHQQSHHQEAWELERFGYKKASVTVKLKVLKILLEYQFTCHTKFKSAVNQLESSEIRLNPMGRDNQGRLYWLLVDFDANLRLYREDQDKETWKLIASDRAGYLKVINMLKSGESIEGLQESEDSNSLEAALNPDTTQNAENDDEEFLSPESESENDDIVNEKKSETEKLPESAANATLQVLDNYAEDNACSSPPQSICKKLDTSKDSEAQEETEVQKEQIKEVPTVEKITLKLGSGKDANFEIKSEEVVPKTLTDVKNNSEETVPTKRVKCEHANQDERDNIKDLPSKRAKIEKSAEKEKEDSPDKQLEPPEEKGGDDEIGEEIEEPLMLIQGEGEGAECDSPPLMIGEEICEPVFYIWGSGYGRDCEMGNPHLLASEKEVRQVKTSKSEEDSSKSENKQCSEESSDKSNKLVKSEPKNISEVACRGDVSSSEFSGDTNNVSKGVSSKSVAEETESNKDINFKLETSPDSKNSLPKINAPSTSNNSLKISENVPDLKNSGDVIKNEVVAENQHTEVASQTKPPGSTVETVENCNSDTIVITKDPLKMAEPKKSNKDSPVKSSDLPEQDVAENVINTIEDHNSCGDQKKDEEKQFDKKVETDESSYQENGIVKKSHTSVSNCNVDEKSSDGNDTTIKNKDGSVKENKKVKTKANQSGDEKSDKSHTVVRRPSTESVLPGVPEVKKCRADSQQSVEDQIKSTSEDESSNSKRKSICDPTNESCSKNYKKAESPLKEETDSKIDKSITKSKSVKKKSPKKKDKTANLVSNDGRNTGSKREVQLEKNLLQLDIENVENSSADTTISNQNFDGPSRKSLDTELKTDVKIHGKHKASTDIEIKPIQPSKLELNQLPTKKFKLDSTSDENDTAVNRKSNEVLKEGVMKESAESDDDNQLLSDPLEILPAAIEYDISKKSGLDDSGIKVKKCRVDKHDTSNKKETDYKLTSEKPQEGRTLRHTKIIKIPEKKLKDGKEKKGKKSRNNIEKTIESDNEEKSDISIEKTEAVPKKREIILTIKEKGKRKVIKKQLVQKEDTSEKRGSLKRSHQDNNLLGKRTREQSESLSDLDDDDALAGKRLKMKPKKVILSTRKKIEEKLKLLKETTDDDTESSEDTLIKARDKLKSTSNKMTPKGKKKATPTKGGSSKKKATQKKKESIEEQIDPLEDLTPVRMSRRIAQLKIREEADRRQLEEVVLRELKEKHTKGTKDDKGDVEWRDSSSDCASVNSTSQGAKGKIKKDKKGKDQKWGSSSGGSDSESEPEPLFEHDEREVVEVAPRSDHEFSPESDLENGEVAVPTRRARTVKKGEDAESQSAGGSGACGACGGRDQPDWILLCDACDAGRHAACLKPILFVIPEGNWYCPPCDHERLIKNLESSLFKYDKQLTVIKRQTAWKKWAVEEKVDADEKKKDSEKSSDESSSGDSDSSSGSEDGKVYRLRERRQLPVSYRFKEYDQLISSAIKEEYHEKTSSAGNQGRGKDISTIIEADKEEKHKAKIQAQLEAEQKDPSESQEGDGCVEGSGGAGSVRVAEGVGGAGGGGGVGGGKEEAELKRRERARAAAHRRRPRKLNSLEVISDDDDNSDEDFKEAGYSSTTGSSTAEGSAEDSDSSHSSDSLPIRRSGRSGKKGRRKIVESPELKKKKRIFDDSSSSESSGAKDWSSKKKKKKSRHQHSSGHSHKSRSRKKRSPRPPGEKMKRCTVQYGGLSGSDESNGWSPAHRTRQKKINYTEMPNTESEDEVHKPSGKHMPDSSDEYKVDTDSTNSDSDKSNKKRKVGDSSDEGKKKEMEEKPKEKPQTLSEMIKEQLAKKEDEEPRNENDIPNKEENHSIGDLKSAMVGEEEPTAVGHSPNKAGQGRGFGGGRGGRGSRGSRGSRGGRGSRGPRGGRGSGGTVKVTGSSTIVAGNVANVENVTNADGSSSTMQGLVGMKIKNLTQHRTSAEGADNSEGTIVHTTPPRPTLPTPFQLEREKKRLEKEAKMAEKEAKKQERLKKKEEKDQQKEQKAKEREEKKMARAEQQIKKKKTNELMQPIPIAGMMQNAGHRVPGPHTQHLAANLPPGPMPHNAMKPGLSVRPFIGQMSTRDGQAHNFPPRGPMDGMRAYGPPGHHFYAGQHGYPPQEAMRHRYPGVSGPREFMAGARGEMTRPRVEHMMGPREQMMVPREQFSGPRGEMMGPRGQMMGPRGEMMGPKGQFTGSRGDFVGPRGDFVGPRGEFTGPRGEFFGPRGETNGPRGEYSGPRGEMTGPRGEPLGPRREITGPRGEMMGPRGESPGSQRNFMGPRGTPMMGPTGESLSGPRGELLPPDPNDSEALEKLGRLAGEDRQKPLKYPVDSRGISPHSSGSDSNPGSSGEHLRGMLTAPGQPPRLQVRAELRGIRPDFSNVSGGGGGGERRRGRGAGKRGAGRGGVEVAGGQGRSTPAHEGTLSVAGSPQPFKPAIDPPSIITRMPHMMPPHFRGSSMYGGNSPMYGSPRGPIPHMAMYRPHQPHPMDPSPSGGGPLQRPPYPPAPGSYYPSQMHPAGGPYAMRYPAPYRPEAPPTEDNQQPKVKFEIKTEPGFQTPPHRDVDSASPHSQDGPARHLSPPPAKRSPPLHDDTQRAAAHPKVKHTENKDRARARMTTASRFPHGPYAPQYGPYGPYAPPGSRPEYPPPTMSPSAPTAPSSPATSAPGVPTHPPPPLSHQPPPLSHQPLPLSHHPPPLSHQSSPIPNPPPPLSHQPPSHSHQPPPLTHQPPHVLQAPIVMETNQTPPMANTSSAPSKAPTETHSVPSSESISAPLSLTTNRRPETPPSNTSLPETKASDKIPADLPRKLNDNQSLDVPNPEPNMIVTDQNDDTSESIPAEDPNPRIQPNEEEGVFGGLVSYFSSQQEDDIDN